LNKKNLTNSIVAPGVVVGRILLATHKLLRVEELAIGPSSNLVHHSRLQVNEDRPFQVLMC
jgi:hypothetical protein